MGIAEQCPIIFTLLDNLVPLQTVVMVDGAAVKPQNIQLSRFARGSIFNTAEAAFLNDFGEGVPTLNISGNTGFGSEFGKGFINFKNLELMFTSYLSLRQNRTADPNRIVLLYVDTVNAEAFSCYPMRFTLTRSAQTNPHLFYYNISLVVLTDWLETAIASVEDTVTKGLAGSNIATTIAQGLTGLLSTFSNFNPFNS